MRARSSPIVESGEKCCPDGSGAMPTLDENQTAPESSVRNAVEALSNVFYLLENCVRSVDDIATFVKAGRPALDTLIEHVQGCRGVVPDGKAARSPSKQS